MPRLSEFYRIAIYMYFADHNPPHFHAIYAEHEALIRIDDGSTIRAASHGLLRDSSSSGEHHTRANLRPTGPWRRSRPPYPGLSRCSNL